jgi:molybdate transport repressor ModE-like protein
MDLRQLAALTAIADHGSFSAAAKALFTVQSNVSGHIARLERELKTTLVDRQRGGLTEHGLLVLERARRVQRELDAIVSDIATDEEVIAGEARLGVIGTTARWLMPQLLTTLGKVHPKVRAVVVEGSTSNLIPRLITGSLDAAIVHLPIDEPEIFVETLFAEDLVLIAHNSHPLAAYEELSLAEVAKHPLLLPPRGTGLRRVIDRAAASLDITLTALAEIDGVRLLTSLAFDGFGPTIVPATAAPRWLKGDFQRVRVPEVPRRVVGWANRRRPAPGAPVRAVRDLLHVHIAERGSLQPGLHVNTRPMLPPR